MSKYTTQVRFICEEKAGLEESVGYEKVDEVVTASANKIFGDFPIFDEAYRLPLEKKILKHYYTREICCETAGLWQLRLNSRMNDIMPYYNKLYRSELITFNPLYDTDLTTKKDRQGATTGLENSKENGMKAKNENIIGGSSQNESNTEHNDSAIEKTGSESNTLGESTQNKNGNSETTTTSGNNVISKGTTSKGSSDKNDLKWDAYSDTPQGSLTNVANDTYLTNARRNTDVEGIENENVENSNTFENGEETVSREIGEDRLSVTNSNGFNETENKEKGTNNSVGTSVAENEHSENRNGSETNDVERSTNKTINNMEDYFEHIEGKKGNASYSKMLMEFRETFLNIDKMIIEELSDLFFLLW